MKNNLYAHICFSVILAIIAIIFSIVALCNTCPRLISEDEPGFDYIGVIVGVLSLLVALLIGWNIYNALDLNKKISDSIKKNKTMREDIRLSFIDLESRRIQTEEYTMGITDFVQGFAMLGGNSDSVNYMRAYRVFVSSILHFTRCDNQVHENINTVLKNMTVCLNSTNTSEFKNIGDEASFYGAINEIMECNSKEFTQEQRDKFVELENRRKSI